MKLTLYRMATSLGGPLIRFYLNRRLQSGKEDAERFPERLGIASLPRPPGKLMWIHAASVGESLSVLPLIDRIRTDFPHWKILITTGTVTSARLMVERLPSGAQHQFVPVDRVSYVRRFLEHWKPDVALWMESEFWPNLVVETRASAVPMIVLNGRMSDKSFKGWQNNASMIRRILSSFRLVLAQSETDAHRFLSLGAKVVSCPGNIKFAAGCLPVDVTELEDFTRQVGDRPLWMASSTHAGEEEICARVHQSLKTKFPNLLTVIVPRHPHRGHLIFQTLSALNVKTVLRSKDQPVTLETDIYIADTLGELGLFYRICPIVFMGKSLIIGGGQNPIEAAQLDCALIFGPDMSNFKDIAQKLINTGGAVKIEDEEQLTNTVATLLDDPYARTKLATNAHQIAMPEIHVLDRIMDELNPFLTTEENKTHART